MIVESTNNDWWLVKTADMKLTGLVPASYLRYLPPQHQDIHDSGKVCNLIAYAVITHTVLL